MFASIWTCQQVFFAMSFAMALLNEVEFSVKDYIATVAHDPFGEEFTLTATKSEKTKARETRTRIRFVRKNDYRKSTQELLGTNDARASTTSSTVVVIESPIDVLFMSTAANSDVYFIERITRDKNEIDARFREILPAYCTASFRGEALNSFMQNSKFKVIDSHSETKNGETLHRVDWECPASDPQAGPVSRIGYFLFDPTAGWFIRRAVMEVGLVGQKALYSIEMDAEYSNHDGRLLPTRVVQTKRTYREAGDQVATTTYSDIKFDFTQVAQDEFDPLSYGVTMPTRPLFPVRAVAYFVAIVSLALGILFMRRRRLLGKSHQP